MTSMLKMVVEPYANEEVRIDESGKLFRQYVLRKFLFSHTKNDSCGSLTVLKPNDSISNDKKKRNHLSPPLLAIRQILEAPFSNYFPSPSIIILSLIWSRPVDHQ